MTAHAIISERQAQAAQRYAVQAEKVERIGSGLSRVEMVERFVAARQVLSKHELAIMDMAVVLGRPLELLAAQTQRSPDELSELLKGACEKLADHYDADGPRADSDHQASYPAAAK